MKKISDMEGEIAKLRTQKDLYKSENAKKHEEMKVKLEKAFS